jgi:transcription elongation factor GreA-like protein
MSNPAEQVLQLAETHQIDLIEDAWLELVDDPPPDASFYSQFLQSMRRAKAHDVARMLILLVLEEVQKRENWILAYSIVEIAAPIWPDLPELRKAAGKTLRAMHAADPNLNAMIASCKGLPLPDVLKRFEAYERYKPGEVYQHVYWGEGIVREFDLAGNRLMLDFPSEQGKAVALDFASKHLRYLKPGSFLGAGKRGAYGARAVRRPDQADGPEETPARRRRRGIGMEFVVEPCARSDAR